MSEHLRTERRGETITVTDRDTPIAQIVPVREGARLREKACTDGPPPGRVPLPKAVKPDVDMV